MTPTRQDVEKVARGLSGAMVAGLLRKPCRSWWGDTPACLPFSIATADALARRGLCEDGDRIVRPLTTFGEAVRTFLQEKDDG